ncbi:MAG: ion transporter [Bacilli bacterium]
MKKRIFEVIEKAQDNDRVSKIYDVFMIITIVFSLVPLMYKDSNKVLFTMEYICVIIFVCDYIVRWWTADLKLCKGKKSFLEYPFTFWAIIDLLSILPSFNILSPSFKILKVFRGFRMLRIFKFLKYSRNFVVITSVIKKSKEILLSLIVCAIFYVVISALFMFNIEPEGFDNFFEAMYWATTALTTVGYGDIYPTTQVGRLISMISSFIGIGFVALPSGVLTARFLDEFHRDK